MFAYLFDVYVLQEYRGRGYSKRLMEAVMAHPDLRGLRRFVLGTGTAHTLYARYSFTAPLHPKTLMERYVLEYLSSVRCDWARMLAVFALFDSRNRLIWLKQSWILGFDPHSSV